MHQSFGLLVADLFERRFHKQASKHPKQLYVQNILFRLIVVLRITIS